jgi:cytoskeletal protein CcmA (bactofilin family)
MSREASTLTVIGADAVISGSIRVDGAIRLSGVLEGALIVEGKATIEAEGRLVGDVFADELSIAGRLEGNASVRDRLHVARSGNLSGNVCYGSLQVDRGGILVGSTMPGEDTISLDADGDDAEDRGALPEAAPA